MNFREELGKAAPKIKQGAKIYVFGAGQNWVNFRRMYKAIVHINLEEYIYAFVDNDPNKQNSDFFGRKIISPDQIDLSDAVVLIAASAYKDFAIERQLFEMGLYWRSDFFGSEYFFVILKRYLYLQLEKFKNRHKGQCCFIVGNGPSLRGLDLDKLKNEVSFASNRIYLMYEETEWRPDYLVVEDAFMMEFHKEFNHAAKEKFYNLGSALGYEDFYADNAYYFDTDHRVLYRPYPYEMEFSTKPDFLSGGVTVTYICIQLAAYMGFQKIYLLGVDHDYPIYNVADGTVFTTDVYTRHFTPAYDSDKKRDFIVMDIDLITAAYEAARKYAEKNNIEIYNATRGGKIEVFERVDFDKLF